MNFITVNVSFLSFIIAIQAISLEFSSKIIGGKYCDIKDNPYQLVLEQSGEHIGGACIIDEYHAITAAHCTAGKHANQIQVRAGTRCALDNGQLIQVATIHEHPDYDKINGDNDISVLTLEKPINWTSMSKPIDLPNKNHTINVGTEANFTGWGDISITGDCMQILTVYIIDHDTCQKEHKHITINDNMICAFANSSEKKSPCQGDSGGALVSNGKLLGILSYVRSDLGGHIPSIYTKVQNYQDFILNGVFKMSINSIALYICMLQIYLLQQ